MANNSERKIVTTRSGKETHWGRPGETIVAGHQLASARSRTFVDYYAKEVTCERCRPIWLAEKAS